MRYDSEFDFDSFGNVIKSDVEIEEPDFDDTSDPDNYDNEWDDRDWFFENQFREYEKNLEARMEKGEPIYASEIGMYSDLHKDVYGVRPHGRMSWLTEYDNIIDDYAEIRAKWASKE